MKGVDFRFEEIRSVGYHVAGNRSDLIPQKVACCWMLPLQSCAVCSTPFQTLLSNLVRIAVSSPDLDRFFQSVAVDRLKALISVLTHDGSVSYWKKLLDYELVYGVRAAKGLEFKSVIVLDFFVDLPRGVQKPWRDLILDRGGGDAPELEGQIKLLYTAVTRCVERDAPWPAKRLRVG